MGRKHKFWDKKYKAAVNLSVILVVCLAVIVEINLIHKGLSASPNKAEVIIVLGCSVWGREPSPTLKQRVYKAYDLYCNGYAGKIIASGSKGYGEDIHEAEAIKKLLVTLGVPAEDIIEERSSTNTYENLKFSRELMKTNGFRSAIVVTNYYHIFRSSMIAKDLKLNASYGRAPMPDSKLTLIFSNIREVASVFKYFIFRVFVH